MNNDNIPFKKIKFLSDEILKILNDCDHIEALTIISLTRLKILIGIGQGKLSDFSDILENDKINTLESLKKRGWK